MTIFKITNLRSHRDLEFSYTKYINQTTYKKYDLQVWYAINTLLKLYITILRILIFLNEKNLKLESFRSHGELQLSY